MQILSKSEVLRQISEVLNSKESAEINCRLRKTLHILRVQIKMEEPESFVDENGVKWIRDC